MDIYLGATGDELCPAAVAALLAYLAVRGGEDGPLFRFRDCRALTREVFVDKVRSALSFWAMMPAHTRAIVFGLAQPRQQRKKVLKIR